jgi:hypothetical protein
MISLFDVVGEHDAILETEKYVDVVKEFLLPKRSNVSEEEKNISLHKTMRLYTENQICRQEIRRKHVGLFNL